MATQHVPTLGRPPQAHEHGHKGVALAGIALALVLAAGVAIWAVDRGGEPPAPLAPDTPVTVAKATAPTRSHAVFLVATAEEAGHVAANMEALDDDRRFSEVTVLVVGSDAEARQLRAFIADLNHQRDAEGLAPIQLVDQRPRPTAGGGPAVRAAGDVPHFTP
jgi:hypothetical protein